MSVQTFVLSSLLHRFYRAISLFQDVDAEWMDGGHDSVGLGMPSKRPKRRDGDGFTAAAVAA